MSLIDIQIAMTQNHAGNIILHVVGMIVAGHLVWHFKGIMRECRRMVYAKA